MDARLHRGQIEIFQCPKRYRTAVMGRRWGKSRLGIWELIRASLGFPGSVDPISPETVLASMPTLKQAKKVLWTPLVSLCEDTELKTVVEDINRSDFRITFKGNKPPIVVAGANDSEGDRLRGLRLYFALLDEFQDIKLSVFDTVIQPAMADTPGSRALFTGTPKGRLNSLYEVYERSKSLPELYESFNMPTYTNPVIPRAEVEAARVMLPPRLFRQEYEASFEDFLGKIFYELSSENLVEAPKDFLDPSVYSTTVLGVDFGDVNPAIVAWGLYGDQWYYLEGWQPNWRLKGNERTPVPDTVFDAAFRRMVTKWRPKLALCDPSRPSNILRLRSILPSTMAGYNPIEEGIEQLHSLIFQRRLMFPKSFPDDLRTELDGYVSPLEAFKMFEAYHRLIKDEQVTEKVEDGQMDHICDSTRYALAHKLP